MTGANGRSNAHAEEKKADRKKRFLEAFAEHLFVETTCREIKVAKSTIYKDRKEDRAFAEEWDEIDDAITAEIEAEAHRRAVTGVEKPVFQGGMIENPSFEESLRGWRPVPQALAEFGETARRGAAAMAVFAAHAEGKKVRCVTGADGVTRVQSREKRPDELGVRVLVHSAPPFTTYSYEAIGRSK
jgi:hypothetical protein